MNITTVFYDKQLDGSMRVLNVLLTPPERWQPSRNRYQVGEQPVEGEIDRLLANRHGINIKLLDPHQFPLNPLARYHPLYGGIDPWRAAKVLTSFRDVDLLLTVFESSAFLPVMLRRISAYRPKIAMWDLVPDEKWFARNTLQNLVLPRLDHVFLLSEHQQRYVEKRWGIGRRTSVVWQHVDTEFFRSDIEGSDGSILAIGDDHGRDWQTLMQAVAPCNFDLIVKTRHELPIPTECRSNIRQVKDHISFKELRRLYARCQCVVIPLRNTLNVSGVGSILEAMAMGKALIVSENDPIKDYVLPGKTCLTVPVGDPLALRAAILQILSQPDLAESFGRAARQRAEEFYSKAAFAARFASQIRQLVEHL